MNIFTLLRGLSREEMAEMGEIISDFAREPQDTKWQAKLREWEIRIATQQEKDAARLLKEGREAALGRQEVLEREGMTHSQLMAAELKRRGDKRSVRQFCDDVVGGRATSDRAVHKF